MSLILTLVLPKEGVSFMMCCDASRLCLGGILIQRVKVIAYASRLLKVHDRNCPTHDMELDAVMYVLTLW